jgi:exodeoxyribonuclease VII small subunit
LFAPVDFTKMNAKPAKPRDSESESPPQSFETALAELEAIVEKMEGGELSLEQSLARYRRGAELLKYCQSALADAQAQIRVLEEDVLKDLPGAEQDA